jgi:Ca2+-binding EF-hand superfamily protein
MIFELCADSLQLKFPMLNAEMVRWSANRYDADGDGFINLEELRMTLGDLGKLDGIPTSRVGSYLEVRGTAAAADDIHLRM